MHTSPTTSAQSEQLLRLPQVEALIGLRRSSIYAAIKAGTFPPQIKVSRRAACWPESHVQAWIAARIAASKGSAQ